MKEAHPYALPPFSFLLPPGKLPLRLRASAFGQHVLLVLFPVEFTVGNSSARAVARGSEVVAARFAVAHRLIAARGLARSFGLFHIRLPRVLVLFTVLLHG